MSWIWAAFMPHPPVMVPEVGRGREQEAKATCEGAEEVGARIRQSAQTPDALLVLSPHLPYAENALFINAAPDLNGSLAHFGAPGAAVRMTTSRDMAGSLIDAAEAARIPVQTAHLPDITQDHGSIVPLYLLAGYFPEKRLPQVVLANPCGLTCEQSLALGKALRGLQTSRKLALLASGDLSHRLKEDGPYGYNPSGPLFDAAVVDAFRQGDPAPLLALSRESVANAGECGMRPALVLLGLAGEPVERISYEGPFGVGYCTAFWRNKKTAQEPARDHPYVRLARLTVSAHLADNALPPKAAIDALAADPAIWSARKGCFVSIKNNDGSLRGCIGTFMPTQPSLDKEILANAIAAATRDPRFAPMRLEELRRARFSVDILSEPELVEPGMELDPARYGVIVVKDGRRGLLLPDLAGVDSVDQQLAIAAQKGGISSLEGAQIYRFSVERYPESGMPD